MNADERRDPGGSGDARLGYLEGLLSDATGAPRGAPAFLLRPSVEVLFASSGDVYLMRPGRDRDVVVRDPSPADRALLAALVRGPVAAGPRLRPLIEAGVVMEAAETTPLPPDDAERFARQLPYFAETGDAGAAQARLRDATVVVVGCGGLGTWALGALASAGIGRFVLVDDDTVDLSNLNRQILYGVADVGDAKAALAARWVRRFDPRIEVEVVPQRVRSRADVAATLADADALVLAADWPPYELARWVSAACVEAGVPFITAGQQPPLLRVGPLYLHARGPCFECHERALRQASPLYDEVVAQRGRETRPATTLGPASGIAGTLVALDVMHLVAGVEPATAGRALLIDLRDLGVRWEEVPRDPNCPGCSARD